MAPKQADDRSANLACPQPHSFNSVLLTRIDHERKAVLVISRNEFDLFHPERSGIRAGERADKHPTNLGFPLGHGQKDLANLSYQIKLKFDCIGRTARTPSDIERCFAPFRRIWKWLHWLQINWD